MINFMMKNIWTFLLSLLIVMFVVFLIAYYMDKKRPFETERYMATAKNTFLNSKRSYDLIYDT